MNKGKTDLCGIWISKVFTLFIMLMLASLGNTMSPEVQFGKRFGSGMARNV